MRLFIAEKPSLARAIADVLPKPHRKGDGFIECGNGQVVTWCIGHLLEQAQPDAYDSRYARWNLADLPIVPEKWQLQPRPSVTKQLNVIKRFLHEASEIVHAGDPDREGQLLVDEVLDYLQLAPEKRQQVQRCLINDLNPQAVERRVVCSAAGWGGITAPWPRPPQRPRCHRVRRPLSGGRRPGWRRTPSPSWPAGLPTSRSNPHSSPCRPGRRRRRSSP